jgi:hypothetical protein
MKIIGLAFVKKPDTIRLVTRRYLDVRVFPSKDFDKWLKADHRKKMPTVILQDKRHFKTALRCGAPAMLVTIPDYDWMINRGILCLDAERQDDDIVMKTFDPHGLFVTLKEIEDHAISKTDVWLEKSSPEGKCAGCAEMYGECPHDPVPTMKRPCKGDFKQGSGDSIYRTYNLSQLINRALNAANENTLLLEPRSFWVATYTFATGGMTRSTWISEWGRVLKTAGTPKPLLQDIVMWVKRLGEPLQKSLKRNPPSELDIKLSRKLVE